MEQKTKSSAWAWFQIWNRTLARLFFPPPSKFLSAQKDVQMEQKKKIIKLGLDSEFGTKPKFNIFLFHPSFSPCHNT
jgi:hypothetical protein